MLVACASALASSLREYVFGPISPSTRRCGCLCSPGKELYRVIRSYEFALPMSSVRTDSGRMGHYLVLAQAFCDCRRCVVAAAESMLCASLSQIGPMPYCTVLGVAQELTAPGILSAPSLLYSTLASPLEILMRWLDIRRRRVAVIAASVLASALRTGDSRWDGG
jgi:hypothetical protein